ncbi:MAG TPA: hypothetical protein V6C65_26395 [Allocoleopsis sp.]
MNQFSANGHSDQQKTENFSPNPEKDDCRIQETQTIDENRELEADTPKLLARSTRRFIGSSEVWQLDHTAMDVSLVASLDV